MKIYGRRKYETRKSQRWERGVYGMVSKLNYKSIRLPLFCLPGHIFRPRNFNIKIGPGDEARRTATQPVKGTTRL